MYRKKLHIKRLELRMDEELRIIVEKIAKKEHCTLNEAVRKSILEYWEKI